MSWETLETFFKPKAFVTCGLISTFKALYLLTLTYFLRLCDLLCEPELAESAAAF